MTTREHLREVPPWHADTNPLHFLYAGQTFRGLRPAYSSDIREECADSARVARERRRPDLGLVRYRVERTPCTARDGAAPPRVITDAAALDELSRILRGSPWPSGADFLDWAAEIVRETGRRAG